MQGGEAEAGCWRRGADQQGKEGCEERQKGRGYRGY